ncbi:MAG: hypothetical protein P4L53_25920 [Candidatus Obscuribacterales bacterium]|nr:hypothetical protein [Candidatus Obscuribacterales bacterium]
MNLLVIIGSFCIGFAARLFQLSLQSSSMVGSSSPFDPYGDSWCVLSSCVYGLVCMLLVLAVMRSGKSSSTTIVALLISGIFLLADFAKPSRFEDGTYLDHAIYTIGMVQTRAPNHYVSRAVKKFQSIAKL